MWFEIHPSLTVHKYMLVFFPPTLQIQKGKVWIGGKTEKKRKQSEMYSAIKVIRDKGGKRVLEVYDDERSSRGS